MNDDDNPVDAPKPEPDALDVAFDSSNVEVGMGSQARPPRIVVVERLYHQCDGSDAITTAAQYSMLLESDEQPYARTIAVGPDARPLDCGWLAGQNLAELFIENTGKVPVRVGYELGHGWLLRPRTSLRACPEDSSQLLLQSVSGVGRVRVVLFPE